MDIHATGVPDTPVEVITDLLARALKADDLQEVKRLVKQSHEVAGGLDPYMDKISTPPSKTVQDLISKTVDHDWKKVHEQKQTQFLLKKEACAGALEGSFIKMLTQLTNAKTVLEVGMFAGTTTLAVAAGLPQDGKVYALELEAYLRDFSAPSFQASGLSDRIEVLVGSAKDSIENLAKRGINFDIAFLDADKTGYLGYYKQLMQHNLIVPGGIIVVDNALMKGRVYAPGEVKDEMAEAIREFNDYVIQDERVETVTVPFRDGVSIVQRKKPDVVSTSDAVLTGFGSARLLQRFKLNTRVALVTGAGQGIGRAVAHGLGEAGASVAVVDIDGDKAKNTAAELSAKGIRSVGLQADVRSRQDCERMVADTVEQLGGLHIAVNNAGINRSGPLEETSEDDWNSTFAVNTNGVFLCCQAEGRHMLKQGYGKIINTASMASVFVPHPQKQAAYNASKAAVVQLTKSVAAEWATQNITVNCISPGILNTSLITENPALKPLLSTWLTQIPQQRLCELHDLQPAYLYLASDASSCVTGHNIVIDGGHTLW